MSDTEEPEVDEQPGILEALGHEFGQELAALWRLREEKDSIKPGEVIIEEGEEGRILFIILSGEFEVLSRSGADGRDTLIKRLKGGQCFGEMTFFLGGPYTTTVRAAPPPQDPLEATSAPIVAEIAHADLLVKITENPPFAAALLWVLCQMEADRLKSTTDDLKDAQTQIRFLRRIEDGKTGDPLPS